MLIKTLQSFLPEYSIEAITNECYTPAMEVFYSNVEYCVLTDGRAATKDDCITAITSAPDGFNLANKHFVSFSKNGVAVGVLDILVGYPNEDTLYIGLLMIHANMHGRGIGKQILSDLTAAVRGFGFITVQLAVAEGNARALSFWTQEGFLPLGDGTAYVNDNPIRVLKMEKKI